MHRPVVMLIASVVVAMATALFVVLALRESAKDIGRPPESSMAGTGATGATSRAPTYVVLHSPEARPEPSHDSFPEAEREGIFDEEGASSPGPSETEAEFLERSILEPFHEETRDVHWASGTEAGLEGQFWDYVSEHDSTGMTLSDVECRSSRCRVDLAFLDMAAGAHLQNELFRRSVLDMPCALHSLGLADSGAGEVHQVLIFDCTVPIL